MINLLEDYIAQSLPQWEESGADSSGEREKKLRFFETNPNLRKKVSGRTFLPFYGNTTVFMLDDAVKHALEGYQRELYEKAGWMLSEKLKPETFHMTLHDLVNSPVRDAALEQKMEQAERNAKSILAQWKGQPPLRMKTTWLFNMMNTSIVLGLAPADEENRKRLSEMYMALETVVPLGYRLTPHITMAYYRPGTYTVYDVDCLRKALHPVELEVVLSMEQLVFQNFYHMNAYTEGPLPPV